MAPAKKQRGGALPATIVVKGGSEAPKKPRQNTARAVRRARNTESWPEVSRAARQEVSVPLAVLDFSGIKDPNTYTNALGALLFQLVATGHSMDEISKLPGAPRLYTILNWASSVDHPFSKLYDEAKVKMVKLLEERATLAATQPLLGVVKTTRQIYVQETGEIVETVETREADNTARSSLIAEMYKWRLAVLSPRHRVNAPPETGKPNEQLEALFQSLKSGPVE